MARRHIKVNTFPLIAIILAVIGVSNVPDARAEYGDVVLNNISSSSDIRPVIFPHWFHRIRYSCKSCHSDLGIKMKAGANNMNMLNIINGEYCGACHDGKIAWSVENCDLCHSGKMNLPTQVVRERNPIKLLTETK